MPSFLIKNINQLDPSAESPEEAINRIAASSDRNFDTVKKLMYGQLDFVNVQERGLKGENLQVNTITAEEIAANTITANEIYANTITANEIAANTITADRMNVNQLSAIAADIGTITAGEIYGIYIEGSVITTAPGGDQRIVLSTDHTLYCYNTQGQLHGPLFGGEAWYTAGIELYAAGWNYGWLINLGDGLEVHGADNLYFVTSNGSHITMGSWGILMNDDVEFTGNVNLETDYQTVAAHNHGIPNGTGIKTDDGTWTWAAYDGDDHNHGVESS